MLEGNLRSRINGFCGPVMFGGGHQPHMALRENLGCQLWYGAEYRNPAIVFDVVAQDAFVAGSRHPVEHDPFNHHFRIKLH